MTRGISLRLPERSWEPLRLFALPRCDESYEGKLINYSNRLGLCSGRCSEEGERPQATGGAGARS